MSIVWSKAVNFAMKGWTNNFAKDKGSLTLKS
jgi:hypothetical protein